MNMTKFASAKQRIVNEQIMQYLSFGWIDPLVSDADGGVQMDVS